MSDRAEQIKAIKEVFEKVKHAPRDENGCFIDLRLRGALFSAIYNVGEKNLFELKDEVYPYLKDRYADFREEAVRTLGGGNGLHLDEFRDEAYKIWLSDTNNDVKVAALDAWAEYYRDSKDPVILKYLYNIFKSENYAIRIRVYAYYNFVLVADAIAYPGEHPVILGLNELEDQKELSQSMDWGKINRIMQQYIPSWKK